MTRKNHIKKKNDIKSEQYIQNRLNFLIENTFAEFAFLGLFSIDIIEDITYDIMHSIYLSENNYKLLSINLLSSSNSNGPDRILVSMKNGGRI
ncbi:MAG: hypothetical protein K9H48_07940 [Melioribacteraceae bacterium]|nr:hypothetical protein [Melioribacteraceae bacterium]